MVRKGRALTRQDLLRVQTRGKADAPRGAGTKHDPVYDAAKDQACDCHDDFFDAVTNEIVMAQKQRRVTNARIIAALRALK